MDDWEWTLTIETGRKGGPGSGHHGHAGRPGQRGGSAPGKGGGTGVGTGRASADNGLNADKRAAAFLADGLTEKNQYGKNVRDKEGNPVHPGPKNRGRAKAEIVKDLAQKSGLSESDVNSLVAQWADSSSDEDRKSLEIQVAAAKEFNTGNTDYVARNLASRQLYGEEGWDIAEQQLQGFVRSMYDHTQEQLAKYGFKPTDTITLYRGTLSPKQDVVFDDGDNIRIQQNALSSWSSSAKQASSFAFSLSGNRYGVLLKMDVPISSIVATARTGFGCLPECEYVVLGGSKVGHQAQAVKVIRSAKDMDEIVFG